jgi:hypothetical protein
LVVGVERRNAAMIIGHPGFEDLRASAIVRMTRRLMARRRRPAGQAVHLPVFLLLLLLLLDMSTNFVIVSQLKHFLL